MNYLLTILSNGRADYLDRALAAWQELARPAPASVFLFDDGGTLPRSLLDRLGDLSDGDALAERSQEPLGMCGAHQVCWYAASRTPHDLVFHLEEDHVLLRPLRLDPVADLLRFKRNLTQLAFVRTPWGSEVEFGGYIPQTPGLYERKAGVFVHGRARQQRQYEWIEQRRNWTCAPAMFRADLARRLPWPAEPGCETAVGAGFLAEHGDEAAHGLWGGGEAWFSHVGVERAPGAHGY